MRAALDTTPGPPVDRPAARVSTVLHYLVCAACWSYLVLYVVIAIRRLGYPFDLEWMEGSSVDHVYRLLQGEKIYVRPSLAFIPFVYPPLYYYMAAAVSLVTGIGLLPLRLVSFACSLGCFWLLYHLVARETGNKQSGLLAAGIFAATYRIGGAWLDLARVDSLFLLLLLAALYVIRFRPSVRSWALAGFLLALSALTKQTGLMVAGPMFVYTLLIDWRKFLVLAASFACMFGLATVLLDVSHRGWYLYYVFQLPARIQQVGGIAVDFWQKDMFGGMPVAVAIAAGYFATRREPWRGPALFYAAVTVGAVGSSWLSRLHSGAYDNVLIPAHACLAVLMALSIDDARRLAVRTGQPVVGTFAAAVCLVQLVALAYDPRAQLPAPRDFEVQRRLIRLMADNDGEVYLGQHGYVPLLAGKAAHAHSWAVFDILRAGGDENRERLTNEIHQALEHRRFRVIVLDRVDPWLEQDLGRYYRRAGPAFDQDALWTLTGYRTRPRWIYLPQ